MKLNNLVGRRFGSLVVVERANNHGAKTMWKCVCDCGRETIVDAYFLTHGKTKTCGAGVHRRSDLAGLRFGRLTVLRLDDSKPDNPMHWVCKCDCGNIKSIVGASLKNGNTKSCGCLQKEKAASQGASSKIHGKSKTRLYRVWRGMKSRVFDKNSTKYDIYGGRGIQMCDEWKNSFEAFYQWATETGYNDNLTIDRIDNNVGYNPQNCKWSTAKEQSRNRRSNIDITIGNTTKTLTEWCEIFNLSYGTVNSRYHRLLASGTLSLDNLFKG